MNQKQVIAKLQAAVKKSQTRIKARADIYLGAGLVSARASIIDQAAKVTIRNVSGLTYVKRDNMFKTSNDNCGFNPETMEGHSYGWYSLTKKIKNKVVLNDYRYSPTTSKHIHKVEEVLKDLGIKYITVQAPRGLQNLDEALHLACSNLADRYVSSKYGRPKATPKQLERMVSVDGPEFKKLRSLGQRATKTDLKLAIKHAEESRMERLERAKQERVIQKAMSQLEIISDRQGTMHAMTDGLHTDQTAQWKWAGEVFNVVVPEFIKRDAVRQGFTRIYVHGVERQPLQVVNTPEME